MINLRFALLAIFLAAGIAALYILKLYKESKIEGNRKIPSEEIFGKDYFFGKRSNYFPNYRIIAGGEKFWKQPLDIIKFYRLSGKMVDFGCAWGCFLEHAKKYFEEAHGYDISEDAILEAGKVIPSKRLTRGNLDSDKLPYENNSFNFITLLETIACTKRPGEVLKKIAPLLTKDGFLMITTPVSDPQETLIGKLFSVIWGIIDNDQTRINIPTEKRLLEMVKNAELEVVEKNYRFITPLGSFEGFRGSIELILKRKA